MTKPRPLVTRLRAARNLVREWRKALADSEARIDPSLNDGRGRYPPEVLRELARFDEALQALAEAIKAEARKP